MPIKGAQMQIKLIKSLSLALIDPAALQLHSSGVLSFSTNTESDTDN